MKLTIVGAGDAFGSGGCGHSCFHVASSSGGVLIDYGAGAPCGMGKAHIGLDDVDAIVISHLHGDHFGGLPFAILDAAYVSNRSKPLELFGPPTLEARYTALAEAMFPGMTQSARKFDIIFHEMSQAAPIKWRDIKITAYEVEHPSGAPSHALRFALEDRVIAYSGDTQWCEGVVKAGHRADLYLLECYGFDQEIAYHMNWTTLAPRLDQIEASRIVLTHMNQQMLANRSQVSHPLVTLGEDGMVFDV